MDQNLVDADLPQEDLDTVLTALDTAQSKLTFLISLTDEQKSRLFKPGEAYSPFIDIASEVVNAHPEIMSGTFNTAGFKKDVTVKNGLEAVLKKINILKKGVEDTLTAVSSDSLISSLEVYDEAKSHEKKIPGLSVFIDKMKAFFPRKRGGNSSAPQNPA